MNETSSPSPDLGRQRPDPDLPPPMARLALKVRLLLALAVGLLLASTLYLLYARGVFEPTQTLVLTTDDSEGVVVGMDMTFSGFPIGRVRRVELGAGGEVRIVIDVARKDAHWLRTSSVFTLVRSLVGGTTLRAHTGVLADPPLPDGAVRAVLRGDATADIPRVMSAARDLLENLTATTAEDAPLRQSLVHLQAVTERARDLVARVDRMAARADTQVFGQQGLVPEARTALTQASGLLVETRASLRRLDAVLADAQAVGGQVRAATTDLGALRAEVDANLRKVESMIDEINRRWPFARDAQGGEVKLP